MNYKKYPAMFYGNIVKIKRYCKFQIEMVWILIYRKHFARTPDLDARVFLREVGVFLDRQRKWVQVRKEAKDQYIFPDPIQTY